MICKEINLHTSWYLFAYSRFAYFTPKRGILITVKTLQSKHGARKARPRSYKKTFHKKPNQIHPTLAGGFVAACVHKQQQEREDEDYEMMWWSYS